MKKSFASMLGLLLALSAGAGEYTRVSAVVGEGGASVMNGLLFLDGRTTVVLRSEGEE